MTIRKLWLMVLILIAVISVSISTFVLSVLTSRYFKDYMAVNYEKHFNQIVEYSQKVLLEDNLSLKQTAMEMETHLVDPIIRIKLYDEKGNTIVDVSDDNHMMMDPSMMGMMRTQYNDADRETDYIEISDNGVAIGQLNITRYSSIKDSIAARMFKFSLINNSLYSIAIVLVIALLIGIFVSKKMSKDLMSTARMAQDINLGVDTNIKGTNISEIRIIQQSLETLKNRLKLKNKSRKVLIDELVHQTRTPLTVLKTHLEGFADNIIDMTPEEIKVCENQIENITAIISNMSNMIDAEKDFDMINFEEFELTLLLKQIVNGLKPQFQKKKIDLKLDIDQKVMLNTDKNKLSQIIYNILTNAYKYTNEYGRVDISYESDLKSAAISIKDNGVGISENDADNIFDAYYRSDTDNDIKGEGLGLYFVKENLNKMNGSIKVFSKLNQGSEFIVTIPKIYLIK